MLKQCGQESSPDDTVIDTALENYLAECASKVILCVLQSLSTREKSLSERKTKMEKLHRWPWPNPRPYHFSEVFKTDPFRFGS